MEGPVVWNASQPEINRTQPVATDRDVPIAALAKIGAAERCEKVTYSSGSFCSGSVLSHFSAFSCSDGSTSGRTTRKPTLKASV